jgi:hypothetical protein
VGKTKRGKGSKIMAVATGSSLPVAVSVGSASPHEVHLVEPTLDAHFVEEQPERLIGDKAYDSDPLDERLEANRSNLSTPSTVQHNRVYHNGDVQLFHHRPQTP